MSNAAQEQTDRMIADIRSGLSEIGESMRATLENLVAINAIMDERRRRANGEPSLSANVQIIDAARQRLAQRKEA